MTFNMLTEFDLRPLHLYIHRWNEKTDSSLAKFVNIFLPFLILYIPIAWIKKALSITVFCLQEKAKIEDYEGDIYLMMDYRNNVHFIDQDKMCIDIYKSDI